MFFKSFLCKDLFNVIVEYKVVDFGGVFWKPESALKQLVLFLGQLQLLGEEDASELLFWEDALAEEVVILEELQQSDPILLYLNFYFVEQVVQLCLSFVVYRC